ncbi:MAG: GNAT family N-acetyltransferase [Anaerolineales bacterium]|nr:GNAT family N-acetyltransferase [Anaerolineales bacterium]
MSFFEARRAGFLISTDPARLDVPALHAFLSERAYWALGRPLAVVERSVQHSLCFGLYAAAGGSQIGFARVVTDYATFAWLCDVFVLEAYRGQGLSKWLIETIVAHPDLAGLRRFLLATRDAHGLYQRYGGFTPLQAPERWLERFNPGPPPSAT